MSQLASGIFVGEGAMVAVCDVVSEVHVGELWRGITKDHGWLVLVLKVSQGNVTYFVVEAHAGEKGTTKTFTIDRFLVCYRFDRMDKSYKRQLRREQRRMQRSQQRHSGAEEVLLLVND